MTRKFQAWRCAFFIGYAALNSIGHAQQSPPPAAPPLDWPPTIDATNTVTQAVDGRKIERYVHGLRASWNYAPPFSTMFTFHPGKETGKDQEQLNSFYVVSPKVPRENAPLMVVLHSANRTAYDYLGYACLDRAAGPGEIPQAGGTNPPTDFYAIFLNTMNDEWYGWSQARADAAKNVTSPTAAELRLFDTIEWVATHYKIDRNRIYLTGMSMGGCGGLALGMPHGNIFAALRVFAPAGTDYASLRMGGFTPAPAPDAPPTDHDAWLKRASGVGQPDPPYIIDSSSQTDDWSKTQPALLLAAKAGHLPLVLLWGPYGHTGSLFDIGKYPFCNVALAFPWLEIRKNEAYPIFTNASSDQIAPWLTPRPAKSDESGQMNAWFRWKNEKDTASGFTMQLWIAHPEIKNPPPTMPDTATANITLRRLQQFKIESGRSYTWQLSQDGHVIASGQATPDLANLLTIPKLPLTTKPSELSVK